MNIEQLSGLELRRAYWQAKGRDVKYPKVAAYLAGLLAVETSIEIAMRELEEFCTTKLNWRVEQIIGYGMCCIIFTPWADGETVAKAKGSTPAEAIARCLCLAMQQEQK